VDRIQASTEPPPYLNPIDHHPGHEILGQSDGRHSREIRAPASRAAVEGRAERIRSISDRSQRAIARCANGYAAPDGRDLHPLDFDLEGCPVMMRETRNAVGTSRIRE